MGEEYLAMKEAKEELDIISIIDSEAATFHLSTNSDVLISSSALLKIKFKVRFLSNHFHSH